MRTRVKFCGLVRPEDVDTAVALGVDAIGFVFYPKSPRALSAAEAAALRRRLPSFVSAVGLFVNAEPERVAATSREAGLDVLQFHGDETPETCLDAARRAGDLPWWRAVRMRSQADLLESGQLFHAAECLLLDAWTDAFGGSGRRFDWSWVPPTSARAGRRLILSGGLDADSVQDAIDVVQPFGVDVSSGIQGVSPREKDPIAMTRFMEAVVRADAVRAGRAPLPDAPEAHAA